MSLPSLSALSTPSHANTPPPMHLLELPPEVLSLVDDDLNREESCKHLVNWCASRKGACDETTWRRAAQERGVRKRPPWLRASSWRKAFEWSCTGEPPVSLSWPRKAPLSSAANVAISPSGDLVAAEITHRQAASDVGVAEILVWDLASGRVRRVPGGLRGNDAEAFAFDAANRLVRPGPGGLHAFDYASPEQRYVSAHTAVPAYVQFLEFAPAMHFFALVGVALAELVHANSHTTRASIDLEYPHAPTAVVVTNAMVCVGFFPGVVMAFETDRGDALWTWESLYSVVPRSLLVRGAELTVDDGRAGRSYDNGFTVLHLETGNARAPRRTRGGEARWLTPTSISNLVISTTEGRAMRILDLDSGEETPLDERDLAYGVPAVRGDLLVAPCLEAHRERIVCFWGRA